MKTTLRLFFFMLLISFASCEKAGDCFKGTGDIITEARTLGFIRGVNISQNVDLVVHHDSVYRMQVTAGENLLPEIETSISGEILYLRNQNNCNWIRSLNPKITVDIWVPSLISIFLDGANADIFFEDTIPSDYFQFDSYNSTGTYSIKINCGTATLAQHSGTSDLNASGKINVGYIYNAGFGYLNAFMLPADDLYITNKGINDITVNASIKLEALIEERGNIYYTGNPSSIKENLKSSGRLIAL